MVIFESVTWLGWQLLNKKTISVKRFYFYFDNSLETVNSKKMHFEKKKSGKYSSPDKKRNFLSRKEKNEIQKKGSLLLFFFSSLSFLCIHPFGVCVCVCLLSLSSSFFCFYPAFLVVALSYTQARRLFLFFNFFFTSSNFEWRNADRVTKRELKKNQLHVSIIIFFLFLFFLNSSRLILWLKWAKW